MTNNSSRPLSRERGDQPPAALKEVLRYGNARPTQKDWKRVVLGVAAKEYAPKGADLPNGSVYGVSSLEELDNILTEFRALLSRWAHIGEAGEVERHLLIEETTARAGLLLKGHVLSKRTGLLIPVWATEHDGFAEMLHSIVVLAFAEISPTTFHQCDECGRFFYDPSRREVKYCTRRCVNRAMARRHRERDPEAHRRYQRELMRRRREEGKA